MGGKVAAYVFTVVIPVVVAAMLPHIGPEIGFPLILVSVVFGLSDFAWMYAKAHHRRPNMLLIGGMALGALLFGGCAIAFFLTPPASAPPHSPIEPPVAQMPPLPAPVAPPVKKYPGHIASLLIEALHKDEDLILKLNGVIQPAVNTFNPRFLRDSLLLRDLQSIPGVPSRDPQQVFLSRLQFLLDELNTIQSSVSSTREEMIQIHNALGNSVSMEIFSVLRSMDSTSLAPLNEYKVTLEYIIRQGSTDRSNSIGIILPQNQRFLDGLDAYVQQVETTRRGIQTTIDEISRNVIP